MSCISPEICPKVFLGNGDSSSYPKYIDQESAFEIPMTLTVEQMSNILLKESSSPNSWCFKAINIRTVCLWIIGVLAMQLKPFLHKMQSDSSEQWAEQQNKHFSIIEQMYVKMSPVIISMTFYGVI